MIQSNFIKKKLFYKNIFILIIFSQFNFSANLLKSEEIETNIGFQDFIKLPNKKNINNESNGKTDIFSFEGFQNDKITNSIKLLGVYCSILIFIFKLFIFVILNGRHGLNIVNALTF